MKLRAKCEIGFLQDEITEVVAYIHTGEEVDVFPTDDGMKVYCVTMDKNFVVGLVSKNEDILCIDIFNTDKEDNFDTYWVDKHNLQIGWKQ